MAIKPRWSKVLKDLWVNFERTALVVVSITIGVFAVGVITGTYVIISSDMNASYSAANPANIKISSSMFDKGLLDALEKIDGVSEVEARRQVNVRVKTSEAKWENMALVAVPDFGKAQINKLLEVTGDYPPENRDIIVEVKSLESLGRQLEDELTLELPDGEIKTAKITGIVLDRTLGYDAFLGDATGYITADSLQFFHAEREYNRLLVNVDQQWDDRVFIQEVADRVEKKLEESGVVVYGVETARRNVHPLDSIVIALLSVLMILGVLVMFLSGSLITNTMGALLGQHLRQIGVMKLVGARRLQVFGMYMVLILCFSSISLVIAIPAGNWAALAISGLVADLLGVVLQDHAVIPEAIGLQVFIATIVPLLSGLQPILRGTRASVQEAFGGEGASTGATTIPPLLVRLESFRLPRPLLISFRNTFRRKGRVILTLFNLTLGGAIFISVFNVRLAINDKMDETIRYFLADVNLDFERSYDIQEIKDIAMTQQGVVGVEGWGVTSGKVIKGEDIMVGSVTIFGPPADTKLIEPVLLEGRWIDPNEENTLCVNEAFWTDFPDLHPGEKLKLQIGGEEELWTVVGILQYTGMDRLFAYTSFENLSRVTQSRSKTSSYRIITQDHSSDAQEAVSKRLDKVFRDMGYRVSNVESGSAFVEMILEYINILIIFLVIMAFLTAIVGSIGLTGALGMNVMERTREIGVMRAVGAYNSVVMRMVVVEGLVISLISYVVSVILSFPITALLANVVSQAIFRSPAKFVLGHMGFATWLVLVLVLSVLSSIIPAYRASRMTIREVLAYE